MESALMIASGLAELGAPVAVGSTLPPHQLGARDGLAVDVAWTDVAGLCRLLDDARGGADTVAVLPLASLRDGTVTARLDVAIVVGRDHPAAARALRSARFEPEPAKSHGLALDLNARDAPAATAVPWFLAYSSQTVLRTQAMLMSSQGPALPFAARALPVMMPRFDRRHEGSQCTGSPNAEHRRIGILLAALALAAAAEPSARRIEAATLTQLMSSRILPRDREISDRLIGLASVFESLEHGDVEPDRPTRLPSAQRREIRPSCPPRDRARQLVHRTATVRRSNPA
ncbi:hypothetical protein [Methylobacterium soli]|nr:hypothetical protein [Methylobacterium soli]